MKLWLVRHAESQNNARSNHARVDDPSLTPRGRLQADYLAEFLQDVPHQTLIASPFRRSIETSVAVGKQTRRRIEIWHDVFENGGCFVGYKPSNHAGAPGMNRCKIISLVESHDCTCAVDDTIQDQGWWHGHERESEGESEVRASSVCERFVDRFQHTTSPVIAVLHADFIGSLLRHMLGHSDAALALPPVRNVSVTQVAFHESVWSLESFNAISHVPERLIAF